MQQHQIHPQLFSKPIRIHLVGAGGTGSQLLTGLARLDKALRGCGNPHGLDVTLFDADTVTATNIGRQLFSPADIGQYKAELLVYRANVFFGLNWRAIVGRYPDALSELGRDWEPDLLITCVDTARSRREIGNFLQKKFTKRYGCENQPGPSLYWLDTGNGAADGQVLLGEVPRSSAQANPQLRLPHVLDLYPEILDEQFQEDDLPSCSMAEALTKQELFINQEIATQALQLLWRMFRYGHITYHGVFVNLAEGRATNLPIDPKAWARFGFLSQDPDAMAQVA